MAFEGRRGRGRRAARAPDKRVFPPLPEGVVLRPPRLADVFFAGAYRALAAALVREGRGTERARPPPLAGQAFSLLRRWLAWRDGRAAALTAWKEGAVAGDALVVRQQGRRSHVGRLHIAVAPGFRGQGLGRALFEGVLAQAEAFWPPLEQVVCSAEAGNAHALAFYRALGFAEAARVPAQLQGRGGAREDEVVLVYPLVA